MTTYLGQYNFEPYLASKTTRVNMVNDISRKWITYS